MVCCPIHEFDIFFPSMLNSLRFNKKKIIRNYSAMYLFALVVALLWAIYPFLLKTVQHLDHLAIWALMSFVSAIAALIAITISKTNLSIHPKDFLTLVLASILGPIAGFLIYFYLIKNAKSVSLVITLAFTTPLFAALIGHFIFKEQLDSRKLFGILLVVIGIMLISLNTKFI